VQPTSSERGIGAASGAGSAQRAGTMSFTSTRQVAVMSRNCDWPPKAASSQGGQSERSGKRSVPPALISTRHANPLGRARRVRSATDATGFFNMEPRRALFGRVGVQFSRRLLAWPGGKEGRTWRSSVAAGRGAADPRSGSPVRNAAHEAGARRRRGRGQRGRDSGQGALPAGGVAHRRAPQAVRRRRPGLERDCGSGPRAAPGTGRSLGGERTFDRRTAPQGTLLLAVSVGVRALTARDSALGSRPVKAFENA
jgi:hypothetical protein